MNREVTEGPPPGAYGPDETLAYTLKKSSSKALTSFRRRVSSAFTSRKKLEAKLEQTRYKFQEGGVDRRDSWAQ